jgi:hypothetical protein
MEMCLQYLLIQASHKKQREYWKKKHAEQFKKELMETVRSNIDEVVNQILRGDYRGNYR